MKPWAKQFYDSNNWKQCRKSFLMSKQNLCERCLANGEVIVAKIVHHKTYLTKANINNPSISLNWNNLEALCQECHNREHIKKNKKRYRFDKNGNICHIPPI